MPRFAANITTMFLELPMSERIQAALSCGFKAAEFLLPYEWPAEEIRSWPGADEIEFILMNTQSASDEAAGCAALPGFVEEFRQGFSQTLTYMDELGIERLEATTNRSNKKARRFAEFLGFKHEGVLAKYGLDGEDYDVLSITKKVSV